MVLWWVYGFIEIYGGDLWRIYGGSMEDLWWNYGRFMEDKLNICGGFMKDLW